METTVSLRYFVNGCSSSQLLFIYSFTHIFIHIYHFFLIFITCPHGVILWKTSLIRNWATIVTASLSVPKLHNSCEKLKGLYYFDMIRQGILLLCTLYIHFLNQSYLIWLGNIQIRLMSLYLFIYSFFNVDNYRTNTVYNKNSSKMLIDVNTLVKNKQKN